MGKNLQKLYSFRTNDELIKKLDYISNCEKRTRNNLIEVTLGKLITEFENIHGEIVITNNEPSADVIAIVTLIKAGRMSENEIPDDIKNDVLEYMKRDVK